jgi:Uncharacterized protein conserved in bacteria
MIFSKIFSSAAIIIVLTASPVFAASGSIALDRPSIVMEHNHKDKGFHRQMFEEYRKDPIKALEKRKLEVQTLLKEGKINKEKADKITAKLDSKIKEIQSFNKLNLQQKKVRLLDDCRTTIEKMVKEGKLEKDKADTIFNKYREKIDKWDGNGYPQFHPKFLRSGCKESDIGSK